MMLSRARFLSLDIREVPGAHAVSVAGEAWHPWPLEIVHS